MLFLAAGLLAGGCAHAPVPAVKTADGMAVPADWQVAVHAPETTEESQGGAMTLAALAGVRELYRLIDTALLENPEFRKKGITLEIAKQKLAVAGGKRLPALSGTGDASRKLPAAGSGVTELDAGFTVRWEVDLWGRLRDQAEAGRADVQAAAADLTAARNALVADVISGWLDVAGQKEMLAEDLERLESYRANQEVISERYRSGIGAVADLEAALVNTASAGAELAARYQAVSDAKRAMQTLLGQLSLHGLVLPDTLPEVALPEVAVPAKVLGGRPDLQAAYRKIKAEDLRTKVAYKDLLPGFSIAAGGKVSAGSLEDLLTASPVWSLLGNLTAPVFQGGQLRGALKIQALTAQAAVMTYQSTLIAAVVEVESAIEREQRLAEQETQISAALLHAENSLANYEERYREGIADILDLLLAQRTARSLAIQRIETRLARLKNRITLGEALGLGGVA